MNKYKNKITVLSIVSLYYFLFLGESGIAYTNDSLGYLETSFGREPLYPLMNTFLKSIFNESIFFHILIFLQGLFACFAVMKLFYLISTHFNLSTVENIICYLLLILPFGIDTLWKTPRYVYTHYVATEAITYSLYYLFITFLLSFLFYKQLKYFLFTSIIAFLCILTRSQLMICIPVILLAAIYVYWKNIKSLLLCFLVCIFIFAGNSFLVNLYHYQFHGVFAKPMENKLTLFSNFLYASDSTDNQLIEDPIERNFFDTVFQKSYEQGYNYTFSGNTIRGSIDNLIASHDKIKYDIVRKELTNYITEYHPQYFQTYQGEQIKKELLTSLLPILQEDNFINWLYTCLSLIPESLMLSFNPVTPPAILGLCYLYALIMSAFIILSLIYTVIREKKISTSTLVLATIFILLATNAIGLSFSIYGLSRYTNYNLGLIYIALYIYIKELLQKRRIS